MRNDWNLNTKKRGGNALAEKLLVSLVVGVSY
jgi:hypothetical protein